LVLVVAEVVKEVVVVREAVVAEVVMEVGLMLVRVLLPV
jgi:hypothetical protein